MRGARGLCLSSALSVSILRIRYYARVPQNRIYDISMKEIAEVIPKIRDELIDPIVRYDNYRRILGKYFTIDQTILSKDNAILSLRIKDD